MKLTWPIMVRRVQGHSMMPTLPPGTIVWGRRWFKSFREGRVVIFTHDNHETVKRLDTLEHDGLYLLGDHAEASTDSRSYGLVPRSDVSAIVFWPRTPKVVDQGTRG